ncbi:DUF2325 domain-containing protein [Paenibacillus campinasensis]|uniref:DUF2325 domain-containing protein n=1 Tax=Paenibacillus campinasensis TaxID=66347 RepID=A0A268EI82_9BACL|nr:DUF2325 domain-containing protein [Paenibacillus campinasensis]PAD72833.1 hypothetical protein CHH67_21230 [Paenibacillus campinasensis]
MKKSIFESIESIDPPIITAFRNVIAHFLSSPFPIKELTYLLQELSDFEIKQFQATMNMKPAPKRIIAANGFIQVILARTKKPSQKLKLIEAIMMTIIEVYEDHPDISDTDFLASEKEKIDKYGAWKYYWALLFFPNPTARTEQRLKELIVELPPPQDHTPSTLDQTKTPAKKEQKESMLVAQERAQRREAELTIDRLHKKIREHEGFNTHLKNEVESLTSEIQKTTAERIAAEQKYAEERQKRLELESENVRLNKEIKRLMALLTQQQLEFDSALNRLQEKIDRLEQQMAQKDDPSVISAQMINHLYDHSQNLLNNMINLPREEQRTHREKILNTFHLMNQIENHFFDSEVERERKSNDIDSDNNNEKDPATREIQAPNSTAAETRTGTFYRKDLGGVIEFDNGETIYVREAVIHTIGLEHEAEVTCEIVTRGGKTTCSNIQIIFQGDDSYAPIEQFLGFIEIGEHHTYYCVDVNNPESRFPIHYKDVEIQQPLHGSPCLFNVGINKNLARLSKLYSENDNEGNTPEEKHTFIKKKEDRKKKITRSTEPFLEGCKIAVIGGQAKWFESVVKETGAEYVHENGESPERIFAELRKCNALFKLFTATSHKAIWSAVEIAKANGIPQFMIEGSKSNLRSLLWENKELIRNGLQKKED